MSKDRKEVICEGNILDVTKYGGNPDILMFPSSDGTEDIQLYLGHSGELVLAKGESRINICRKDLEHLETFCCLAKELGWIK